MNESIAQIIEPLILDFSVLVIFGILAAYLSEKINRPIKLPEIFVLMILGIIVGPVFQIFDLSALSENQREFLIYVLMHVSLLALLFEGGFNLDFRIVRKNLSTIALMASIGVVITAFVIGFLVSYLLSIPLIYGLLVGAILAATDPASVISLGRSLKLPKRLTTILEGESAYNDATSIILFLVILNVISGNDFMLAESVKSFFIMLLGGMFVGGMLAVGVKEVLKKNENENYSLWIVLLLAVLSYFIAEHFGMSGVISCVTAGMVISSTAGEAMTPREYRAIVDFWEFARFGANSIIFLVLGTLIKVEYLLNFNHFVIGFLIVFALIVVRYLVLKLFTHRSDITENWKLIMTWGGLRGSIPMILAISIASSAFIEEAYKVEIVGIISAVIFLSISIQGLTSAPLIEKLNIRKISKPEQLYEETKARIRILNSALDALEDKLERGEIDRVIYDEISGQLKGEIEEIDNKLKSAVGDMKELEHRDLIKTKLEIYDNMVYRLKIEYASGKLSEESYKLMREGLDAKIIGERGRVG